MATAHPIVAGVSFKDVFGFPGYCVGDDGSLWTCRSRGGAAVNGRRISGGPWRRMSPSQQKSGHLMATLYRGGLKFYRQVHHLVLEAFVGPCPAGMECCHGVGGPGDNSLGNLRWDTRSANAHDRNRFGRSVTRERHGRAKLTTADVEAIRALPPGPSRVRMVVERYGIGRTQARRIISGDQWK